MVADPADVFREHQPLLFGIAYRMLGIRQGRGRCGAGGFPALAAAARR